MADQQPVTNSPAAARGDRAGEPACLVLHGLGGGPYELAPLIAALEGEGLRVVAPVLPGHEGRGPVMPSSSWREWAATAESAFDELAATGQPVVVVGFSTGATLALYLASRRPVASLVLLAPFLAIRYTSRIPVRPATVLRPLAKLVPNLPRRPPAVRDPEMRRWASTADRFRTFSIPATVSALELIDLVKPLVPGINVPTLIIQGRLDTVVEPAGASWLHDNLASSEKTIIILAASDHLVALNHEREQVIALAKAFVLTRRESTAIAPGNRFWRDASERLIFEMFRVPAAEYPDLCKAIATTFSLTPDYASFVAGLDVVFQDYGRGESVVGMAWDDWTGFTVVAKTTGSESLVREIAEWLIRIA